MENVNSKTVSAMDYLAETKTILVRFSSGVTYAYYDCSQEEYDSIKNDESIGSKLRRVTAGKEYKKL